MRNLRHFACANLYNDIMSLDERLEALTQTVELMPAMQRDNERRFDEQFDRLQKQFAVQTSQHEQIFGQVALRFHEVGDYIDSLARIAGVHQERLDSHEQRLDDLEQGPPA
jgi:flagellar capping protein FliD